MPDFYNSQPCARQAIGFGHRMHRHDFFGLLLRQTSRPYQAVSQLTQCFDVRQPLSRRNILV